MIESLFISHHLFTWVSSMFIVFSSSLALWEEAKILVSSANIRKDNLSEELEISLMYNKNSNGPNALPWGIPHMTECMDDSISPVDTYCWRSLRKLVNHWRAIPRIPYLSSLLNILWLTVSKALAKSRNTPPVNKLLSIGKWKIDVKSG